MKQTPNKFYILSIYVALTLVTIIAYEPVRHNGFVGFDDAIYVTDNPHVNGGITREAIVWAFTTPYSCNWHSLTWLSHMLDCQLFDLNPLWHHLTSLFFHIANTLLLFWVLKRMTGAAWRSAFVAAAFALHPLHVESVTWLAERKDVLSGFFWMLTMIAYVRYAEQPAIRRYLLIVLAFCLGLLSKSTLVTLPFVLLLLDYWPLGRFHSGHTGKKVGRRSHKSANTCFQWPVFYRLVREKITFFILSAVSSVITFLVQRSGGAMEPSGVVPTTARIANAFISYIRYIGKMFCPDHLALLYLYPCGKIPMWQTVISVLLLLAMSICVVRLAQKHKYLPVGWFWYLGTLVPVIGIVQIGPQAMADRYTYLPSIGIFIMVAWGAAEVSAKWRFRRMLLGILAGLVLAVLLICTRMQVRYWQDSFTLGRHAVEVTKNNFIMHTFYGGVLYKRGEFDEAITHFNEALRINPRYSEAYGRLGEVYIQIGKDNLAIANLTKSIELVPTSVDNLNNLAWILATTGDANLRNPARSVEFALRACELSNYEHPGVLDTLAAAYASAGNFPEAVKTAERAVKLAEASGKKDLALKIQKQLELYKASRPYHER
jgi:Tfp pilus assembly protein PilF